VESTPKKMKKGKKPLAVVDSNLRRSLRLKEVSNGFKSSVCTSKKCLACSPNPPIISTQVIRALGAELYQMDEANLTNETLLKGGKIGSPVGGKGGPLKGSSKKSREDRKDIEDAGKDGDASDKNVDKNVEDDA
jgi:hypothetical protein